MAGATGNALLSVEQRKHLFVGEAAEIGNHEVAQPFDGFGRVRRSQPDHLHTRPAPRLDPVKRIFKNDAVLRHRTARLGSQQISVGSGFRPDKHLGREDMLENLPQLRMSPVNMRHLGLVRTCHHCHTYPVSLQYFYKHFDPRNIIVAHGALELRQTVENQLLRFALILKILLEYLYQRLPLDDALKIGYIGLKYRRQLSPETCIMRFGVEYHPIQIEQGGYRFRFVHLDHVFA